MRRAGLCLLLLLSSCASSGTGLPSPEADKNAPGMIPAECESLLRKTQEWGYRPDQKWKPAGRDQALAVLRFFERFALVPPTSSDFFRAFAQADIPEDEDARKAMFEQTGKAQVCDFSLASQFLTELTKFPWAKSDRKEVANAFLHFELDQQARSMPLLPRMAAIQVYVAAVKARLAPGNLAALMGLGKEGEKVIAESKGLDEDGSYAEMLKSFQKEVVTSENLREKLARLLPLP
jgi:hypothetical protein